MRQAYLLLSPLALLGFFLLPIFVGYGTAAPQNGGVAYTAAEKLFIEGQQKESDGDLEGACAIYQEVARKYPETDVAGSALFQCGLVRDEKLNDVEGALDMYRRVLSEHPKSGASTRAEIRGKVLAPYVGEWAGPYKEFQALATERKEIGKDAYDAKLDALLKKYPEYPGADGMLFYLGRSAAQRDDYETAEKYFRVVLDRFPHTLSAAFAYKGLGDLFYLQKKYAMSLAFYDTATALAEQLEIPQPAPRQRLRAYRYMIRQRVLLGAYALMALCALGLLYVFPEKPAFRPAAKYWASNSLAVLPLFALLFALGIYLLKVGAPTEEEAIPLSGHETWFVAASYGLVSLGLLLGALIWPGVQVKKHGRLVFWTCFPALLLGTNYCVFYALDLVSYLESAFFGINPLTLQ